MFQKFLFQNVCFKISLSKFLFQNFCFKILFKNSVSKFLFQSFCFSNRAETATATKPEFRFSTVHPFTIIYGNKPDVGVGCIFNCDRAMKPADQGIQSLGISTLHYGYRFKFRFEDNGRGELLFHGTSVGSALYILRENFRPRVTITKAPELLRKYGCVPPLVWFSRLYSCAAWHPMHMSCGQFALGEPLAQDAPQPVRVLFHARVEMSQRLAHKPRQGNNDQHAFSPESVLSIVGLDVIATCFSLHTVECARKRTSLCLWDSALLSS